MFKKRFITLYLFLLTMVFSIPSTFAADAVNATPEETFTFILKNVNLPFHERTDAVNIDAGKNVSGSKLAVSSFSMNVKATRKVNPDFVFYNGPREITNVYTSQVNDTGSPSDTGK